MNTLSKHRRLILEIAAVAAILIIGAFLRFYEIRTRPGFDWDEPVYAAIAQSTVMYGFPTLQAGGEQPLRPNLFHPPFDHYIKGYWFHITGESGVEQARVLAGIESIVLLLLIYLLVRYVTGRKAALLALLLVSSDGWLILTNRLNLLENGMMPIGVAGLCFYAMVLKKNRSWCWWILAGVILGLAAIYKHTGLYFLLVPVLTWLLTRGRVRGHVVLLGAAALVVLAYIAGMYLVWGNEYLTQSWVQIQRTYGGIGARGLNYGIDKIIQAIIDIYWIFFVTIVCLIVGSVTVMVRLVQYIRKHQLPDHLILLSWSVAAIAFLGIIALKAPHYLITVLVPLYVFLAVELTPLLRRKTTALVIPLLIVVLVLNFVTWHMRFVQRTDNALLATYDYATQYIPADARVLTEECIGVQLKQTYYNIQVHQGDLQRVDPTHVILYYSTTVNPPANPGLDALLQRSTFVTSFSGFKEVIEIYRVEGPPN